MVEVQSERGDRAWLTTDLKYENQIREFIEENYGKIILRDLRIHNHGAYLDIQLPAHMVGLDVLILFISDLEFDDVDTTPGVGQ